MHRTKEQLNFYILLSDITERQTDLFSMLLNELSLLIQLFHIHHYTEEQFSSLFKYFLEK